MVLKDSYSARRLVEAAEQRGPLVMEVNSYPSLEGIEGATGVDIAGKTIEHVERNEFVNTEL